MRYKLSAPATLHTTVQLPASKSISNRALILHALAQGHITPTNLSGLRRYLRHDKSLGRKSRTYRYTCCRNRHAFSHGLSECNTRHTHHHRYRTDATTPHTYPGGRLARVGSTNRICRKRRFPSPAYHRYNIDRRRNQPCRKCKFTIHIRFTDDRPYPEKTD